MYKQPFWTSHTHTLRGRSKWRWLRLQSQPHRTRELTHRVNRTAYAHTRARTSCTTLNTIIRRACVRACWQMPANCPALNTSDAVWSPPCLGDNILTTIAAISHVHEHAHTGGQPSRQMLATQTTVRRRGHLRSARTAMRTRPKPADRTRATPFPVPLPAVYLRHCKRTHTHALALALVL